MGWDSKGKFTTSQEEEQLDHGSANSLVKDQIVSILGFSGPGLCHILIFVFTSL